MTNQNVVAPETMTLAVTTAANPSPIFPYPQLNDCSSGFAVRTKCLPQLAPESRDGRVNAWLESLKASSPTHAKAAAKLAATHPKAGPFWTTTHPSALDMFGEITGASVGKQIVMFLDYDGTLSPIVDDPNRAFMSVEMRDTVRDVAKYFPTAIVSGRCRHKVYSFVRLAELCYAGSHGMDIKIPAKGHILMKANAKAVLCQPASKYLPMIDKVYRALLETTKSTPGAKVENNKFCLSVHFRCVNKKRWSTLADQVRSVVEAYPKLKVSIGRKVLEIRPSIKWDKGKALEFLLESLGFTNCKDVFPVYIGDDRTDEDAFKVLRSRGHGSAILVSKMPKETDASYSLQEPSEVMDFLQRLVEWKRRSLEACPKV
ncbi:putative trehalose-phosphate phosphatase 6 [Platanthera guangdongensis]|uniref:Trehalose 6-phosphate phosphatase n=1 Tax=Platanthera guangdongensis TaxID=2320717 RepID=A0ABR2LIM4_9ASPA